MKVGELIAALHAQDLDANVVLNIWTNDAENTLTGIPDYTVEGDVVRVVKVSAGVAIKGNESI